MSVASLRAKLGGLLQDRVLVETNNNTMSFDDENTTEDVAIRIAKDAGIILSEKDLAAFTELMRDWHEAMQQFIASCRARPIDGVPAHAIERKRLALSKQVLS